MVERRRWLTFMTHAILAIGVVILAFPIYVAFVASTHSLQAVLQVPMPLLPGEHLVIPLMQSESGVARSYGPRSGMQRPRSSGSALAARSRG